MITIIFAPPRTGKTCFMTHLAHEKAFDRERNTNMVREINATQVPPEEVLSDKVYYYDRNQKALMFADSMEIISLIES